MLILKATHVHNIQWNLIIMATFGMGPKAHEWQVDCISFPYFSNCYRNNLGLFRADLYCKVAVSGVTTHLVLLSLKQVVSILDILNVLSRLSLQFPVTHPHEWEAHVRTTRRFLQGQVAVDLFEFYGYNINDLKFLPYKIMFVNTQISPN